VRWQGRGARAPPHHGPLHPAAPAPAHLLGLPHPQASLTLAAQELPRPQRQPDPGRPGAARPQACLTLAARERRARSASLHVDCTNAPALGLYAQAGFEVDGQLEDYYAQGRPAYKLLAELGSPKSAAFLGGAAPPAPAGVLR
jgi:hypothetical protein